MESCLALETCLGFDWNKDPAATSETTLCWLHSDANNFSASATNDNVDQYTREDCEGRF